MEKKRNLWVIPTDKSQNIKLSLFENKLYLGDIASTALPQHIYITSDEEIKEGLNQWYLDKFLNKPRNSSGSQYGEKQDVIIMTDDQDLIKEGIQAIPDEFLEWFVENPTCEEVEVKPLLSNNGNVLFGYKIIIPKEESKQELERGINIIHVGKPKQETLEEVAVQKRKELNLKGTIDGFIAGAKWQAAKKYSANELSKLGFIAGAKWQQKRSYSEEEVIRILIKAYEDIGKRKIPNQVVLAKWFEQFKKK